MGQHEYFIYSRSQNSEHLQEIIPNLLKEYTGGYYGLTILCKSKAKLDINAFDGLIPKNTEGIIVRSAGIHIEDIIPSNFINDIKFPCVDSEMLPNLPYKAMFKDETLKYQDKTFIPPPPVTYKSAKINKNQKPFYISRKLIKATPEKNRKRFTVQCLVIKDGKSELEGGFISAKSKEKAISQAMNIDIERNRQKGYTVKVNKRKNVITVLDGDNLIAKYKKYSAFDETELEKSNNMKLLNKTPKLNSKNGEISISRKQIKDIAEKIGEQKSKQKQHQKSKSIEI